MLGHTRGDEGPGARCLLVYLEVAGDDPDIPQPGRALRRFVDHRCPDPGQMHSYVGLTLSEQAGLGGEEQEADRVTRRTSIHPQTVFMVRVVPPSGSVTDRGTGPGPSPGSL